MSNEQRVVELTAMQTLIERFQKRVPNSFAEQLFLGAVVAEATELLAKEKQQIVDAWNKGWKAGTDDMYLLGHGREFSKTTPEDYYSLTYKQINVREL